MAYRLKKRFLAWLLPAVLVFAQHSAIAHLVSHGSDKSADPQQKIVHIKLCDKCLSAAKFINASPKQEYRVEPLLACYGLAAVRPFLANSAEVAFQSCRDPPEAL
ncbi:MAG: hypothetical protein GTO41_04285 [Burkholderiales bacterium]|nr:hypothetical protein [Burkholderiales bacterium]